ncbi:MAG: fatty-acid--CoA ligase [Bryobacteraceae bacterium]|nr:MAG: fatty-acid--CoA ligase [Bryobacteraceae bacterium]
MARIAPPVPKDQRTVYRLLRMAAETWDGRPALHQPLGKGQYRTWTWREYLETAERAAAALRAAGVKKGDIVGLSSETRAEFYLADMGVMSAGAVAAALYTSLPAAEQVKTLEACRPLLVFVENPKSLRALNLAGLGRLQVPVVLLSGEDSSAVSFEEFLEMGGRALAADPALVERMQNEIQPSDPAILYLTSGATGEPKMGLVSHNAILANCECGPPVLPLGEGDSTLAFLPSAHITQRLVVELLMVRMGVEVYFSEGLSKMPAELRRVRPTFFVAPPRVWERIYASVTTEIRKKPAAVRKLFYLGLGVGSEAARARAQGREPSAWVKASLKFFDRAVFARIRERLGGRLKVAASGAAPLGRELAEFFSAIGLPLIEGYGLTEGGVLILNPLSNPRPGSIGRPLPGVEARISGDGELLVRGEMLFSGYFNDPEATAAVLRDGWLHTGDLAEIDRDGYVWITGRKKEVIVSSNGKKIYPAKIEGLFKLEPLVNQVMLVGDRMPYVTALFTIHAEAAATLGLVPPGTPLEEAARAPAVEEEMKRIVAQVNRQLAPFEQIRRFRILDREFSIESGEMTPTMKLRRGKIIANLKEIISELYMGREEFE